MAAETCELIVEHRKSTSREGYEALFWVLFTCVGLTLWQLLIFPGLPLLAVVAWYGILVIVGGIGLTVAVLNIRASGVFCCRLTTKSLDCKCPVAGCGATFSVAIGQITQIEKEEWSESHRWYVWDDAGNRYWLTSNYDNPADEIIRAIKQMRPELEDDPSI